MYVVRFAPKERPKPKSSKLKIKNASATTRPAASRVAVGVGGIRLENAKSPQNKISPVILGRKKLIRKPWFLPRAPSKVFTLPQHPPILPEEHELMIRRTAEYKGQMEAIRDHLRHHYRQNLAPLPSEDPRLVPDGDAEHLALLQDNDAFNYTSALFRHSRNTMDAIEARRSEFKQRMIQGALDEVDRDIFDSEIRSHKELVKEYFTEEDLEQKLEQSLDRVVEYNFAMDSEGRIYKRDLLPQDFQADVAEELEVGAVEEDDDESLLTLLQSDRDGSTATTTSVFEERTT